MHGRGGLRGEHLLLYRGGGGVRLPPRERVCVDGRAVQWRPVRGEREWRDRVGVGDGVRVGLGLGVGLGLSLGFGLELGFGLPLGVGVGLGERVVEESVYDHLLDRAVLLPHRRSDGLRMQGEVDVRRGILRPGGRQRVHDTGDVPPRDVRDTWNRRRLRAERSLQRQRVRLVSDRR